MSSLVQLRLVSDGGPDHPHRLASAALRSRSPQVLDALVECAGGGPGGIERVRGLLREGTVPHSMLTSQTGPYSVALATVLAGLHPGTADAPLALALATAAADVSPRQWWWRRASIVAIQNAVLCGAHDTALRLLEQLPALTRAVKFGTLADVANPYLGTRGEQPSDPTNADTDSAHVAWEEALSFPFVRAELSPLRVDRAAATLFDGLAAASEPGSVDGPLVTVVMPTYAPDEGLLTSVRSLLAQSYGNLEILLVDDCSPPGFIERYEQAAALDPRITLLRMPVNGGSYLGRNAAMARATGRFITFQDGDDWSHPERITQQVRMLQEHPEAPASLSSAIRATDDLAYTWLGFSPQRDNASSLMITRPTLERLGPFQRVRKGADSEYHKRIEAVLGPLAYVRLPLAVTRLRAGSLSRADFTLDWHTPDRVNYRNVFGHWHRTRAPQEVPLDARDGAVQPFPPPRSFLRALPGEPAPRMHFTLGYLLDASLPSPLPGQHAIAPALPADETPAVIHREDFGLARQSWEPFTEEFLELVQSGAVDLISATDQVHLDTLVVLRPGAVEMRDDKGVAFTAGQVIVTVPVPDRHGRFVDLTEVSDTCVDLFGHRPRWAALDSQSQQAWADDGWELPRLEELIGTPVPVAAP
ncbi:glycosyltransferase family 2 protein [Ornithinimicrobium cryptoxanthini]|nr:glycosyltransferase family A protein [Ornithinimicrobium cryptoxanthini]